MTNSSIFTFKTYLIGVLLTTNLIFAQSYNRATYDVSIDKTRLSKFMLEKELDLSIQRLMMRMVDDANRSSLVFLFNKESSKCFVNNDLVLGQKNNSYAKGVLTFLYVADDIYYNSKEETYYEKRGDDDYIHLAKIAALKISWKLENESKKVNNLIYRKATATFSKNNIEHQVQAWYCPSIPVQLGPSFFNGLPGLITEVYVSSDVSEFNYNYVLSKLDYNKKIGDISPPLDRFDVLTEEESEELFRKANEGFKN
jgi:GLPGLI family protein